MSKTSICGDVREWSNWWRDRKKSDAHPKRDPAALLKSLPPEELVDVALATLNTLEAVEAYSYALHLMQTHLEHEGRLTLGWCVSLASKSGAFNKWEKTLGGYAPDVGPHGEYLIFECWEGAKAAQEHLPATTRKDYHIYPVVLAVGSEPRTTLPRNQL